MSTMPSFSFLGQVAAFFHLVILSLFIGWFVAKDIFAAFYTILSYLPPFISFTGKYRFEAVAICTIIIIYTQFFGFHYYLSFLWGWKTCLGPCFSSDPQLLCLHDGIMKGLLLLILPHFIWASWIGIWFSILILGNLNFLYEDKKELSAFDSLVRQVDRVTGRERYCSICNIQQSDLMHHDKILNKCLPLFSHHDYWFMPPVYLKTQKAYLSAIVMLPLQLVITVLNWYYIFFMNGTVTVYHIVYLSLISFTVILALREVAVNGYIWINITLYNTRKPEMDGVRLRFRSENGKIRFTELNFKRLPQDLVDPPIGEMTFWGEGYAKWVCDKHVKVEKDSKVPGIPTAPPPVSHGGIPAITLTILTPTNP
ncbi:uncharacterized protein K452DRAFT_345331 [Aplosporella prunicola CBS 121167]|uniref:Uncharacterized protein n=1 Tax=Aplosporella prunicola CBS 121167 TaxID=1176127 RepID=A0A6A6BMA7_9PEZI|nr:uncharacterized protein K452DRAFT_345331 [Aplosporella prunicola CBS 121167]KAF2143967.1 hypothetical protein K452DRAFT_345331 [Aplosporella prunicola CBS 121167]